MKLINLVFLFFIFTCEVVNAESPMIWAGDFAKSLAPSGFEHDSGRQIRDCGATVPSSGGGLSAPIGSICQYSSGALGALYIKTGALDTAWTDVLGSTTGWALDGNAGTTAGTDFLGTTDDTDLVLKRNGVELARLISGGLTFPGFTSHERIDINQPTILDGGLNLRGYSDSLAQQLNLQAADASNTLYITLRNNGDLFGYNSNGAQYFGFTYANRSFYTGQVSGTYHLEANYPDTDTTPATPSQYSLLGVVNTDVTDNNYSGLVFQGGTFVGPYPDSGIFGIHESHTAAAESGSLEFWTRSSGTFARRMRIAPNGIVTLDDYGAGVVTTDSNGELTTNATLPGSLGGRGTAIQESRTGTFGGVDTTYTLTQTPLANAEVVVYLGTVIQRQGTDYTISGSTITFAAQDVSAQDIYAVYRY